MTLLSAQRWFMGGLGAILLRGGVDGVQDGSTDIPIYALSNAIALAGLGGEGIYSDVYLAVSRTNVTDWTVNVTPVVDRVQLDPVPVTLAGTGGSLVEEILEVSLMQDHQDSGAARATTFAPRGQWFQLLLTSADAPDGLVIFEGIELGWDVGVEGLGAVNAG